MCSFAIFEGMRKPSRMGSVLGSLTSFARKVFSMPTFSRNPYRFWKNTNKFSHAENVQNLEAQQPEERAQKNFPCSAISFLGILYMHSGHSRESLNVWFVIASGCVISNTQEYLLINSFFKVLFTDLFIAQYYRLLTIRQEPSLLLTVSSSLLGNAIHIIVKFHFVDW